MAEMEPKTFVMKTYMSELKSKYAAKPWSETLQLVRRCMDKARTDTRPCEPIIRCLQKLRSAQNVTSVSAMVTKLEMIAYQRGLGSHVSPTETACYLTADLFYLEVLLLPGGGVEDVKVAQHGEAPESNVSLLQLLRMKKFEEFSQKLNDFASLYNIPGDNDTKVKVYTSLQHLQKDLVKISNLPRRLIERDVHVDMVLNGRLGSIIPSRGGSPMCIEYYIRPADILMKRMDPGNSTHGQVAMVVVGARTTLHRLQMDSVIPAPPQVDSLGLPVFRPLSEVCAESLPACFLLRLQPPLPTLSSLIRKMSQITELPAEAGLQGAPLFQLLRVASSEKNSYERSCDGKDARYLMSLPDDEIHSYVFSGAAWACGSWAGAPLHTVSFTQPAHVPALLELLRHQSAINALLTSCITSCKHQSGLAYDLTCEILPESDCSFSVTFSLDSSSLAVLLVSVLDSRQVICRLHVPGVADQSLDEYISKVLARCMSIPITMRAIRKRVSRMRAPRPSEADSAVDTESSPPPLTSASSTRRCSPVRSVQHIPPAAPVSSEPMEEEGLPSSPDHHPMPAAACPVADGVNGDPAAKPAPSGSVGV